MPISRKQRMIRTAISPRLPTRTFRNNLLVGPEQLCTKRLRAKTPNFVELREMLDPLVRPATASDTRSITDIYAHHVRHGAATFEIEAPAASEMDRRRLEIESHGLPYLVVEKEGVVVGYSYAARYRTRPAYRFTVEDSIYIHPDFVAKGLGQLLLARLIELCLARRRGQMIAIIGDSGNTASMRLHAKFGFREIGVLEAVGRKFGRWIDTVIMQRALYTDERLVEIGRISEHNGSAIEILQQAADSLRQSGRYRWVGIYKIDRHSSEVRNLVFSGPGAPAHPVFSIHKGLTGIAIRERRTVNVADVSTNPLYLTAFESTKSEIIVPVFDKTRNTLVGTIDIESEDLQAFSEEDEIFLEDCAEAISAVWQRA
jgi:phosphinothricin acetyltransferase